MALTKQQIVAEIRRRKDFAEKQYANFRSQLVEADCNIRAFNSLLFWINSNDEKPVTPSVTPKKKG